MSEENPASLVTLASPVRSRIEFYSDAEADAIIEWASVQPGLRWQVGRVLLLTLRYTGLRAGELVTLRISDVDLDARRISLVGKDASLGWSPSPTFWRTRSASTSMKYGPSSQRPRTCSPTQGQPEAARSLRASGAARSGGRGRDFGGRDRSALPSPVASHLCHEPHPPGRGHPHRAAPDGPFQHRDYLALPAPVGRRSHRCHRSGVPRKLRALGYSVVRISGYMSSHASSALR